MTSRSISLPTPAPYTTLSRSCEQRVRDVLDPRTLQPRIEISDVDEARAAGIRARRDGADELLLSDSRRDVDHLSRLNVRAEVDDQPGEAFRSIVHRAGDAIGGAKSSPWTSTARSPDSLHRRRSRTRPGARTPST